MATLVAGRAQGGASAAPTVSVIHGRRGRLVSSRGRIVCCSCRRRRPYGVAAKTPYWTGEKGIALYSMFSCSSGREPDDGGQPISANILRASVRCSQLS